MDVSSQPDERFIKSEGRTQYTAKVVMTEEFVTWDKSEYDAKTEEFLEKFNFMKELYEKHIESKSKKSAKKKTTKKKR